MTTDLKVAPGVLARPAQPWRYLCWAIIAALAVWQSVIAYHECQYPPKKPDKVSDFTAFYAAGRLALNGQNIYDFKRSEISRRPFLYPPTFAVLPMMPLALLPYNAALIVFILLNNAMLFGLFWLLRDAMWRLIPRPASAPAPFIGWQWLRHPDSGLMLAGLVCLRFVVSNLRHGNANMFVAFSIALGLWLILKRGRAFYEFSSGVAIALGTAIKVTPGLFGLYLLWTWRKWALLGGALGLIFFLVIVPAVPMGFPGAIERLKEYKNHIASAATGEDAEDDPIGHEGGAEQKQLEGGMSLRGIWMRYLTPRPMRYENKLYYANVVNLPESTARNLCRAGEFLLLGATIFLTVRTVARTDPAGIALSWGLVANAMLLISPLTRKAHVCAFLVTAVVLIALMQQDRIRGRARMFCIATLAILSLEGAIFSVEIIGKFNSMWLQGAGAGFWMLLATFSATCFALWKLEPLDHSAIHPSKGIQTL